MVDPRAGVSQKKGRGCFFYGCLISIVLTILIAGLILFLARRGMQVAFDTFTTTTPMPVPTIVLAPDEINLAKKKFDDLMEGIETGTAPVSAKFNTREVNALIASEPSLVFLKDRIYVDLNGDNLAVQFNIPLGAVGRILPPGLLGLDPAGRYINGKADGTFALTGDEIQANVSALALNGHESPPDGIKMANEWIRQNRVITAQDPDTKRLLEKIKQIVVKDGALLVESK